MAWIKKGARVRKITRPMVKEAQCASKKNDTRKMLEKISKRSRWGSNPGPSIPIPYACASCHWGGCFIRYKDNLK